MSTSTTAPANLTVAAEMAIARGDRAWLSRHVRGLVAHGLTAEAEAVRAAILASPMRAEGPQALPDLSVAELFALEDRSYNQLDSVAAECARRREALADRDNHVGDAVQEDLNALLADKGPDAVADSIRGRFEAAHAAYPQYRDGAGRRVDAGHRPPRRADEVGARLQAGRPAAAGHGGPRPLRRGHPLLHRLLGIKTACATYDLVRGYAAHN